ncbi:uncharacterized protein BT62DRAFT_933415 [Guyanagaster necrorhizus]|uniref:F-box domain-containing protein n=1 Tax=Guyanagaster necrorhizus TaxID=856835 RepID=A0A9P7VS66_9AGAR|nr:uncharacterized protein BT62DRAFT_933415 [Guyanagaster necrorhizus MCA 3950]KAG7445001.1 hypothetical protein BT62DRAFT_933415 [Guyanagaster necrorhizus MCA 3950]
MQRPLVEDSEELKRFRAEWKAEVEHRKAIAEPNIKGIVDNSEHKPALNLPQHTLSPPTKPQLHVSALSNVPLSEAQGSALAVYRSAVAHEQRGDLDEALRLYRQAFRKDPNVDRAYHREEIIASSFSTQLHDTQYAVVAEVPMHRPKGTSVVWAASLANIVAGFPEMLHFEPEIEEDDVHLQRIPDEVLIKILTRLDPTSLERFAAVNRKARVFSLDSTIWRKLVTATYRPPQVPNQEALHAVLERCLYDYRRVFIEHPRVRMDGVYIAVCHYVRSGLSENSWVNVNHLITYHRYLRFYPNGLVISLRTNEEQPPQHVIPLLKPSLRMKGCLFGRWTLTDTTIYMTNLVEGSGNLPNPPDTDFSDLSDIILANSDTIRYVFSMSLSLRSRPLGRWNKLDISSFNSVNIETGDVSPVVLKHERSFWFSKVRSYA